MNRICLGNILQIDLNCQLCDNFNIGLTKRKSCLQNYLFMTCQLEYIWIANYLISVTQFELLILNKRSS